MLGGGGFFLGGGTFEQCGECSHVHPCVVFYDLNMERMDVTRFVWLVFVVRPRRFLEGRVRLSVPRHP